MTRQQSEELLPRKWFAPLVVFLLLMVWASLGLAQFNTEEQTRIFDILAKISTITAVIVGGVWTYFSFFRQRLSAEKLNLQQTAQALRLDDGRCLVRVLVQIENVGQTRVDLSSWELRAERILPLDQDSLHILKTRDAFTEYQAKWETIAGFEDGKFGGYEQFEMRLEPGEGDSVIGNLVIPTGEELIQVVSQFPKGRERPAPRGLRREPTRDAESQHHWIRQTVLDLREDKGVRMSKKNQISELSIPTESTDYLQRTMPYRKPKVSPKVVKDSSNSGSSGSQNSSGDDPQ